MNDLSLSALFVFFKKQVLRELLLHIRQPKQLFYAALFFLMVIVFFPLTLSPDITFMRIFSPGLIWIAALLALFLSSFSFFQQDYEDGVLEQWILSGYPLSFIVRTKLMIHWGCNLLALLIFCPFFALLFHLTVYEMSVLMVSLLCGTPAIIMFCGLAAAFNTGTKGILMALIILPLVIPIMIFGSNTLAAAFEGNAVSGYFAILAAISLLTFGFLPYAIAGILRISLVNE